MYFILVKTILDFQSSIRKCKANNLSMIQIIKYKMSTFQDLGTNLLAHISFFECLE